MNDPRTLLVDSLRRPETIPGLTLPELDTLVRQARRTNLLAKIAIRLEDAGCLDKVHPQPRAHFVSERIFADKHRRDVLWEVRCLERALADFPKVVLLKGAAYTVADLPAARGRIFSDVDLMVPKEQIAEAESTLRNHGWIAGATNAYDQRYYRTWMHQIPPLDPFPARDGDRRAPHHRAGDVAHAGRGGQAVRRGAEGCPALPTCSCWRRRTWCCTAPCTCSTAASSMSARAISATCTTCLRISARRRASGTRCRGAPRKRG